VPTARRCIFCQKPPGSGEHLFPDWMNATFPVDRKVEKPLYGRHIANEEGVKTNHWSAAEIANETTNMLCHDCNTGWMSVLEGAAKWVLEPMMLGQHRPLSVDEQILAGRWAVRQRWSLRQR
jgi:hypothetical protein